jgi:hypothetical protein
MMLKARVLIIQLSTRSTETRHWYQLCCDSSGNDRMLEQDGVEANQVVIVK